MASWKVSFFFESFQQSDGIGEGSATGWAETWYIKDGVYANVEAVLASQDVLFYSQYRRNILATNYRIAWVRASDTKNPRNTKIVQCPQQPAFGIAAGQAAQVNCCILMDFTALDTLGIAHHRRFLMRGLTNFMIDGNVIAPVNQMPQTWANIQAFMNYMSQQPAIPPVAPGPAVIQPMNWAIQTLAPPSTFVPITTLQVNVADPHTIQVQASPALATSLGQKYVIKGVRFPYYLNRQWTDTGFPLQLPAQNWITLGRSRRTLSGTAQVSGTMKIAPVALNFFQPNQAVVIGLRKKNTGRPTHQLRGRRNPVV